MFVDPFAFFEFFYFLERTTPFLDKNQEVDFFVNFHEVKKKIELRFSAPFVNLGPEKEKKNSGKQMHIGSPSNNELPAPSGAASQAGGGGGVGLRTNRTTPSSAVCSRPLLASF